MSDMLSIELAAVPNPDFDPYSHEGSLFISPHEVDVVSLREASKVCRDFIWRNRLGGGNWTGGTVYDRQRNIVARVSYNGRVWEPGDYPTREIPI